MLERGGSSQARSSSKGLRYFAITIAVCVCSTILSLTVFIGYAASRDPREPSSRRWLRPAVVFTPFTLHRGNAFKGATDGLHLPIFPGSVPIEIGTFDQKGDHSAASSNSVGLVLVRVLASAPLPTVKNWYEQNLPKPFSELLDQQILGRPGKETWFQALDVQIDRETVLYRAEDSMASRGIILQPSKNNDGGTIITAYYLSHGR
jgi:hypothetical protein